MPGHYADKIKSKFQSTPSRGGRHDLRGSPRRLHRISIHALPRRATLALVNSPPTCRNFNPRPPAEGDDDLSDTLQPVLISIHALPRRATRRRLLSVLLDTIFQSTPSRGGRRIINLLPAGSKPDFNPRPPAEGDMPFARVGAQGLQFQSTPSRGGRLSVS